MNIAMRIASVVLVALAAYLAERAMEEEKPEA